VQFQIDGANFGSPVPLSGGQAISATISTLAAGTHSIAANYSGGGNYNPSTASTKQTVNDSSATVQVSLTTGTNPSNYGASLTFTAAVNGQYGQVTNHGRSAQPQIATGSVTWSTNTGCGATPLTAGSAICTTSILPGGPDNVGATYGGDSDHNGGSGSVQQGVNEQTPLVTVTNVNPASEGYGAGTATVVTATLTWTGSGNAPAGNLAFKSTAGGAFAGSSSCSKTNTATITCTQSFTPSVTDAAATYTMSASYSSDGNYNSASSTQTNNFSIVQSKVTPTVSVLSVLPNPVPYGIGLGAIVTATLSWTGSGAAPTASSGPPLNFSSAVSSLLCVWEKSVRSSAAHCSLRWRRMRWAPIRFPRATQATVTTIRRAAPRPTILESRRIYRSST
jgi:hypothetical protein